MKQFKYAFVCLFAPTECLKLAKTFIAVVFVVAVIGCTKSGGGASLSSLIGGDNGSTPTLPGNIGGDIPVVPDDAPVIHLYGT